MAEKKSSRTDEKLPDRSGAKDEVGKSPRRKYAIHLMVQRGPLATDYPPGPRGGPTYH